MSKPIEFTGSGPFDNEEQAVICDVVEAVLKAAMPGADDLLAGLRRNVERLDRIGELLASYPSSFSEQSLGRKTRSLHSLVEVLSASNLSNFDMFLPNRALTSRNLITGEMFGLIQAGCDAGFVDYLVRPDHSEDETAAFREFLFGATSEQLDRVKAEMNCTGKNVIGKDELSAENRPLDANTLSSDPALAMFEFFLSRHLQAAARRQADLPGPKRTAEEYVMLHYLEQSVDKEALIVPPAERR